MNRNLWGERLLSSEIAEHSHITVCSCIDLGMTLKVKGDVTSTVSRFTVELHTLEYTVLALIWYLMLINTHMLMLALDI